MADGKELTPEQILALKPIDAPIVYASQFRISVSATDATIVLQRPHPATLGAEFAEAALVSNSAIVHMSLHSLKDLSILLRDVIANVEKDYGPIVTDFSRQREKK